MEAITAILSRRSVRKFKETEIPEDIIEKLAEAADAAPSACNRRPVRFYFITKKEKLAELDASGMFTKMPSPLTVAVVGDMTRALPRSLAEYWVQDAAAATENILIAANALGLGTCWNGVYPQERVMRRVSAALGLSESDVPFALIHVGYPDEDVPPHEGYDPDRVQFIK